MTENLACKLKRRPHAIPNYVSFILTQIIDFFHMYVCRPDGPGLKFPTFEWIALKSHTVINGPWVMNCTDFGYHLTSPLVATMKQTFVVLSEISLQLLDGL